MHRASEDTQKRQRRDLGEPGQKMTPPFIGAKGDATSLNKRQLPKVAEIAPLLQIKRPTLSPLKRRLQNATCIADLRSVAKHVTPRSVFEYVDGAADEEVSIRLIREEYRHIKFRPRILRDVSTVDPSTQILGQSSSMPLVFAPTGYSRMMHHEGEIGVGRAATELGVPYGLSTVATTSPEDLRAACPDANLWFQLYMWSDRAESRRLVLRAHDAGYSALVLTVDTAVPGYRRRDVRNGLSIPPQLTARTIIDMARHPTWWANKLTTPALKFACAPESWTRGGMDKAKSMFDPSVTFDDVEWLRTIWPGKLVVKGVQTKADAKSVVERGVDAMVLSNHGGRQMDRTQSVLSLLPEVVAECGDDAEILIDSGITCGADILAAVALGAKAALVGRAYLYGLMAGGERGVLRAGQLLESEIRNSMGLLGVRRVQELTPDLVQLPRM